MKNRIKKLFGRYAAAYLAVILALAIVIPGIIVIAEFTKSSRAKRVIGTYGESGAMFSSNYLSDNTTLHYAVLESSQPIGMRRIVYSSSDSVPATTQVTVCNYAQNAKSRHYDTDITYDLTAMLVWVDGANRRIATASEIGSASVTITYGTSGLIVLNNANLRQNVTGISTLTNDAAHADIYTVTFSPSFGSDGHLQLYMLANPQGSLTGIQPLDAVFRTAVRGESADNSWHGYFNETGALNADDTSSETSEASAEESNAPTSAYDGFRYVIEGTGTGTCKLSWNGGFITLSEIFALYNYNGLTHNGAPATVTTDSEAGWLCIEFDVNSDVKSRYDTQFYYTPPVTSPISGLSWSTLNGYVRLDFEAAPSESSAAPEP